MWIKGGVLFYWVFKTIAECVAVFVEVVNLLMAS